MVNIMFVCLGNICRSPMAEFLMKDYVAKRGASDMFRIASAATGTETEGDGVHSGTKQVLESKGIDCSQKRAVKLKKADYDKFDYFVGMDESNRRSMVRLFGGDPAHKVSLILDYTDHPRDVADPWFTGNFDKTREDIENGIEGLYRYLRENAFKA
ncbi:MAG: low molecular weight phosphotyrosine protein phosphatase [Clostridiales bacterium]|nr:low molecular weight phosphotyrosine protein phosphatase [Clostridiales bacterium]